MVIDIFSKLANVVPMKEKSGPITLSAMKESFNKMGFPMSVYSDDDRAFQAGVKDFFEKEGITHVVTLTHANVVGRFIRTMKNMIHDRVRFNRGSWTVMLSKALDKYNDTIVHQPKWNPRMPTTTRTIWTSGWVWQGGKRTLANIQTSKWMIWWRSLRRKKQLHREEGV